MKKFICFLLSFIVLLSTFIVPVYAADEISTSNGEIIVSRGLFSRDTEWVPYDDYYAVSGASWYSNKMYSGTGNYIIEGYSSTTNPVGEYMTYINFHRKDDTAIVSKDNNIRIELRNITESIYCSGGNDNAGEADPLYPYKEFNPNLSKSIKVGYLDKDNNPVFIEGDNLYTINYEEGDGQYNLILDIPYQGIDLYVVFIRFYFNVYTAYNINSPLVPYNYSYGFNDAQLSITHSEGDKTSGLLQTILEWLEGIWEGIINLPDLIRDKLSSLFDKISTGIDKMQQAVTSTIEKIKTWLEDTVNGIIEGLKDLFIPKEDYFEKNFFNLYNKLREQFGALLYPIDILTGVLEFYNNFGNTNSELQIPYNLDIFGVTLFSKGTVPIRSVILQGFAVISEKVGFDVHFIYLGFIDVVIILMMLHFISKKLNSIISDSLNIASSIS